MVQVLPVRRLFQEFGVRPRWSWSWNMAELENGVEQTESVLKRCFSTTQMFNRKREAENRGLLLIPSGWQQHPHSIEKRWEYMGFKEEVKNQVQGM